MPAGRLIAIAVGIAALVFFALWRSAPIPEPLRTGASAPRFSLPELGAEQPRSLERDTGKVVLVNFWATWCKPCLDEMPAMQRLYDALPRDDFELLAISVDEGSAEVIEFRDRLALSFPILLDADRHVANQFQTFRFPESFLIGRDGRIAARYIGPKDWDSELYVKHLGDLVAVPGPSPGD